MGDRFRQISMEALTDWVFDELEHKDQLFDVPRSAFFVPSLDDPFRIEQYGVDLAGPGSGHVCRIARGRWINGHLPRAPVASAAGTFVADPEV